MAKRSGLARRTAQIEKASPVYRADADRQRLDRGEQDQRREGQPLPRHDADDRSQRRVGQEVEGLQLVVLP